MFTVFNTFQYNIFYQLAFFDKFSTNIAEII